MNNVLVLVIGLILLLGVARAGELSQAQSPDLPRKNEEANQRTLQGVEKPYTLSDIIHFALRSNPKIIRSHKDIEIEAYGIDSARADRMPRLDFTTGAARYRYPTPVVPISGSPLQGVRFPPFDNNIYEVGATFRLPLYRGGRLDRAVHVAEMRKSLAEDASLTTRHELVYNLTSVYFKILQLEKLLEANEASMRQLEAHRQNVERFLQAGTVPRLELLKTEVELAHAQENVLLTRSNLESAYELLKTLMGLDDTEKRIRIVPESLSHRNSSSIEEIIEKTLSQRPEYRSALRKQAIAEEQIRIVQGKRLPEVSVAADYKGQAGDDLSFKENWNLTMRLILPIFDGGSVRAEVGKTMGDLEKAREEERSLRLDIVREVKDALLNLDKAKTRIEVTSKALDPARETVRIELLKYATGAGTSTEVIDAQTALLRAENDYYQALFDKEIALASLRRATGEDYNGEEDYR